MFGSQVLGTCQCVTCSPSLVPLLLILLYGITIFTCIYTILVQHLYITFFFSTEVHVYSVFVVVVVVVAAAAAAATALISVLKYPCFFPLNLWSLWHNMEEEQEEEEEEEKEGKLVSIY